MTFLLLQMREKAWALEALGRGEGPSYLLRGRLRWELSVEALTFWVRLSCFVVPNWMMRLTLLGLLPFFLFLCFNGGTWLVNWSL